MHFFKYEGLGNDFILIPQEPSLDRDTIRSLCDRHTGVGADGILFVFQKNGQWNLKIFNADASMAEMCGNGIRCVAQWISDQGFELTPIITDAGVKTCTREDDNWSVDMGVAQINGNHVSMGNPHAVYLETVNSKKIDPSVNTEFVELKNTHEISVRVFERGVGETMACGTGACASVAWLVENNHLKENTEIRVHLNGGSLYVTARQTSEGLRMQMKGPARMVFKGEV